MVDVGGTGRSAVGGALTALILTLFRVNGRLLRSGDILSKDLGLTAARWQVLGALVDTPRTVAQIARHFESTRQGVLWVVTALVNDGIVELIDNPDHKRAKLVRFTEHGKALYAEMNARQEIWISTIGEQFTLAEVHAADAFLARFGQRLLL